jgi:hypothetical protein
MTSHVCFNNKKGDTVYIELMTVKVKENKQQTKRQIYIVSAITLKN